MDVTESLAKLYWEEDLTSGVCTVTYSGSRLKKSVTSSRVLEYIHVYL